MIGAYEATEFSMMGRMVQNLSAPADPTQQMEFRLSNKFRVVSVMLPYTCIGSNVRPVISVLDGAGNIVCKTAALRLATAGDVECVFSVGAVLFPDFSPDLSGGRILQNGNLPPDMVVHPNWRLILELDGAIAPIPAVPAIIGSGTEEEPEFPEVPEVPGEKWGETVLVYDPA